MSKAAASKTRIENVENELRSTSTCTAATVAELQSLLYGDASQSQKENVRARSAKTTGARPTARSRPGTAASVRADDVAANLSPRQRYVVATQAVNTVLRSLSDALKTPAVSRSMQPAAQSKPPANAATNTQRSLKPARTHSKSVSSSQHPLKERSVSQVTNSTAKTKTLRRSSSYSSFTTPDPGMVATAECARIAFAYLTSPEAIKSAGKNAPEMTLEHGRLALIGKLVTHGLDNLAVKEMRLLKKRLEKIILGNEKSQDADRPASQQAPAPEKESLATLLDFGDVEHSHCAVPIITNLQIYVLRIIARVKRPRLVEEAWKYLKMSHPSNPANLISHMAKEEQHRVKAARQLESLAQAILQLCPSISSSADAEQLQPSPDIVICLQHLAFGVRQRWWALAKHQGDKSKELVEPFNKCLVAFSRRSTLPALKKYRLAESLYSNLLGKAENTDFSKRGEDDGTEARNSTLVSLARAAELPEEALRWLGTSSSETEETPVASAIRSVRIAAMRLEGCLKNKPSVHQDSAVDVALEALSGNLNGAAKDLESLFLEAHTLRRVATKMILVKASKESTEEASIIQQQCLRIIAATIRFSKRFVGCRPPDESSPHRKATFNTYLTMAAKLIRSVVDSVSASCRLPPTPDTWKELDGLIQDSVRFVSQVEENAIENEAVDAILRDISQSPFVKFSNLYWSFRRPLQKVDNSSLLALKTMQRSTGLLESRERTEQDAGQLGHKLEQLSEMLASLDRIQESQNMFRQCIVHLLNDGLLSAITEITSHERLSHAFGNTQELDDLGRLLKSYIRSFAKHGLSEDDEVAFFDDDELTPSVRGALLESQLETYLQILSRNRAWDSSLNSSIRALVERLSNIYEPAQFPMRRQRLHLLLLQLQHGYPDILSDGYIQENFQVYSSPDVSKTEDKNLSRFGDHSRAILILKTLLQQNDLAIQKMQECFGVWQSIIDAAKSWADVTNRIDDAEYWLEAVQATVDLLCAKGEEYQALPIMHLIVRTLELQKGSDPSRLVLASSALGVQFLRLGYSGKAGLTFAKAEALLSYEYTSTEAKLRWHIGYAEYLLGIGNVLKCQSTLATAESIARDDTCFMDLSKSSTPLSGRLIFHRAIADACYVSSLLSSAHGDHKCAAKYARQAVLVNRRIWAALEANATARKAAFANQEELASASSDPMSSTRDDKGAPVISSITHEALKGPDFWSLIPCLYKALMQHSAVIASQGLLDEAIYMIQQAEKVAAAVGSRTLLIDNASRLADIWIQSGRPDKAKPLLDGLDVSEASKHLSSVPYHLSLARMHNASQNFEDEVAEYDTLEKLLRHLSSTTYLTSLESFTSDLDALSINVSALTLNEAPPEKSKPSRGTRTRATASKAAPKTAARTTARTTRKAPLKAAPTAVSRVQSKASILSGSETSSAGDHCTSLHALHAEITYRRVATHLLQGDVTKAMEVLSNIQMEKEDRDGSHAWVHFKAMLAQAIKSIADDFTFNTLPESTIAFPSIPPKDRQSSEGVAKRPTIKPPTKIARGKRQAPSSEDFVQLIQNAREKLVDAHSRFATAASNHIFRQLSAALSQATVLLSAVSQGRIRGSIHPLYSAYMSELPKQHALALAQDSVEVDHEPMSREIYLQWPTPAMEPRVLASPANFQHDYIDVIPESWAAISLALSEEQDEIYITRYERNNSPFVLKLPLARHSSRDLDEEEFSFVDGKREMEEIIELSDFTTRNAKNLTTKESKKQWWEDREALDTKLRELLLNIENIWLGGFKGIFSDHVRQPALLARFRKSFDNILSRHLPSRQKKTSQKKPSLDPRVLELFIGLGDASNEELDLDEALTDLIYFVVDILQFNGEPNAYDEIDFDAIVIETYDALRAYYDNAQHLPQTSHTILILDKNLHMLPWESLPCLEKLSISRLPSLAALRDRLRAARQSRNSDAPAGHYISASTGGTSMLNPSGDLKHTSQTLKPHLDGMTGPWTHIRDRPPSESEFEAALRDEALLLYFGHGSGNQYIRCKTVRKLYLGSKERSESPPPSPSESAMEIDGDAGNDDAKKPPCATTFLFGCSSVHLSENGIYEPSGMLSSYLTAGAPAVLGMLWDVTDRDCDRLAVRVGELWGLWPSSSSSASSSPASGLAQDDAGDVPPTARKRKGKGKAVHLGDAETASKKKGRRGMGLDEALRGARSACKLRYLNGGAAVVYGIPVYLE